METLLKNPPAPAADTEERREIIHGITYMAPSPIFAHQYISLQLVTRFNDFVNRNKLGVVLYSPMDVILQPKQLVLQPDVLVVLEQNRHIIQDYVMGAPDLVVEIASPGSLRRDLVEKREIYQQYGVQEYWVVVPEIRLVEVLALNNGTYTVHSTAVETGPLHSRLLAGFSIEAGELWPK